MLRSTAIEELICYYETNWLQALRPHACAMQCMVPVHRIWVITTVFLTTRKYFCVLECLPEISSRHVYIQQKSRIVFLRVIVNTSVITIFRCLWIIHLHNTVNVLWIQYNEPRAASGVFNDARKVPQSLKFVTCIAYNFYSVGVKRCSCTTVWICKISYVS